MPRRETQGGGESSGSNAPVPSEGTWAGWLARLNAILEVAYNTADVETGC